MNDPFDASGPVTGHTIASSLSAIIDRFGPAVFFKPEEVRLLLRQDCPDSNGQIDLVLATLAQGIPQRLLAAHGDAAIASLSSESVERLTADPAFDRATATWAVRTWAIALALPVTDLDRPRPAAAATTVLSSFASVVTPLAGPRRDDRPVVPSPALPVAVAEASPTAPVPAAPEPAAPEPAAPAPAALVPADPAPAALVAADPAPAGPVPVAPVPAAPALAPAPAAPEPAAPEPAALESVALAPAAPAPAVLAPVTQAPAAPVPSASVPAAPAPTAPLPTAATPVPIVVRPKPSVPTTTPSVADAPPAPRPVARSSLQKPAVAGAALVGIALAAWFLWPRTAAVPLASPPEAASVPASQAPTEPARASVPVEPPRRVAPDVATTPVTASPPPVPPKVAPSATVPVERPAIARVDAARVDAQRRPADKPPQPMFAPVGRPDRAAPVERPIAPVGSVRPAAPVTPAPAACTRATCGSVVSVRPLDATGSSIELIVRMDDRGIHTVRQSGRWQIGARVQRIDDRYVAIGARAATR